MIDISLFTILAIYRNVCAFQLDYRLTMIYKYKTVWYSGVRRMPKHEITKHHTVLKVLLFHPPMHLPFESCQRLCILRCLTYTYNRHDSSFLYYS